MNKYIRSLSTFAIVIVLVGAGCSSAPSAEDEAASAALRDTLNDDATMEADGDAMAMEALGECPAETSVATLDHSLADFDAAGPFDLTTFTDAKAAYDSQGRLKVYVANKDFALSSLKNLLASPVRNEENGTGVLELTFYGGEEKAGPAEYDPTKKYNEAGLVSGQFRVPNDRGTGSDLSFFFTEGSATLLDVSGGTACGTLDLTGTDQRLVGTFVATLE